MPTPWDWTLLPGSCSTGGFWRWPAPAKEKWAFLAVGHLGGDASVLKLTPMLRAWPGESQHQRAVTGLEVLRTIGSDTALMQLNSIAQKLKFKGLKKQAQEFMEAIARDKGLTRSELEDRIVPDLELDARGSRTFDFGPRQFKLVFGQDMKPMISDDDRQAQGRPAQTGQDRRRRQGRRGRGRLEAAEKAGQGGPQGADRPAGAGDGFRPPLEAGRVREAAGQASADDQPGAAAAVGRLRLPGQADAHLPRHRGAGLRRPRTTTPAPWKEWPASASSIPCT